MLLHGAGMDSRLWDAIVPELARHHDLIRYDPRGLGRSTPPAEPVGLSMGGESALDFALAHPGASPHWP